MSCHSLFDAVLYLLAVLVLGIALEEHVPLPVGTFHDIVVDTSVFSPEEYFRFALKSREIFVGVSIICHKSLIPVISAKCEIYHIFFDFGIINGLRSPYPVSIGKFTGIILRKIHNSMRPVDKIV